MWLSMLAEDRINCSIARMRRRLTLTQRHDLPQLPIDDHSRDGVRVAFITLWPVVTDPHGWDNERSEAAESTVIRCGVKAGLSR
jgi:hypothetical protein